MNANAIPGAQGTRIGLAALALVAIATLALLVPSWAQSRETLVYETKVTLSYLPDKSTFLGKVKSDVQRCRKNRIVQLRKQNGQVVDSTNSDNQGFFSFPQAPSSSKFQAKALRGVFHLPNGNTVRCKADFSPLVVGQA